MRDKQKINFINDQFKDYTIRVFVEQKRILYYKSDNDWLGRFFLETNEFGGSYYWFYNNLIRHFKNSYDMNVFLKFVIEKIIGRSLNQVI